MRADCRLGCRDGQGTARADVAALAAALRRYRDSPAELNGMIVAALADVGAHEHAGLMREAFEAQRVDTLVCGTWAGIQESLDLS